MNLKISTIIPELDPNTMDVIEWIAIRQYNASNYKWPESVVIFETLNKLKDTAKIWYSYTESEIGWSQYLWGRSMEILQYIFKSTRNVYKFLMNILNHKPIEGSSLYNFYFDHSPKINKLKVYFSELKKSFYLVAYLKNKICNVSNVSQNA